MTQTHSTTKKQSYTHLTEIERGQIAAYIQEGYRIVKLADGLVVTSALFLVR